MPGPRSRTARCTLPSPSAPAVTNSRRSNTAMVAIASQPLRMRFSSTCCSCTLSPSKGDKPGFHDGVGRDATGNQLGVRQFQNVSDQLAGVDRLETRVTTLQQRAQTMDHLGGALILGDDVPENGAQLFDVGRPAVQEVACRLGVAQDRRQRLPQLVRQRAGQLAEDGDTRQVRQFAALLFISSCARRRAVTLARVTTAPPSDRSRASTDRTYESRRPSRASLYSI